MTVNVRYKENNIMLSELVKSALVLLASFLVRWAFTALGIEIDDATFNAIVAALVTLFLGLFGYESVKRAAPSLF